MFPILYACLFGKLLGILQTYVTTESLVASRLFWLGLAIGIGWVMMIANPGLPMEGESLAEHLEANLVSKGSIRDEQELTSRAI